MTHVQEFVHDALPSRVIFGAGALARLAEEMDRLGMHKALILCTPNQAPQAQQVARLIGHRAAGICDQAAMHVPVHVAERAAALAREIGADGTVAFGGGSTIGLAKAIALSAGLPCIAVPTTYAGSEMTPIYGITDQGVKRTGRDARVLPRTVIYDPELTLRLPVPVSVTSGINAMAHAAEGLYSREANPISSLMAEEGLGALAEAIPRLHRSGADLQARQGALYGAWLCGAVLGAVGMALHHKLCHTLGGSFDLPHAQTHTVILPHALAYNHDHARPAMRRMERALGTPDVPLAVFELARRHGAPTSLRELGMKREDLGPAVALALTHPYWNPRPIEEQSLARLLQRAFDGAIPVLD